MSRRIFTKEEIELIKLVLKINQFKVKDIVGIRVYLITDCGTVISQLAIYINRCPPITINGSTAIPFCHASCKQEYFAEDLEEPNEDGEWIKNDD